MTAAIQRRLVALEAAAGHVDSAPVVLIVRFVAPGHVDDEPTCARIGDDVLMRSPGETGDDFTSRARAEALRQRVGRGPVPLVLLNSCDERAAPKSSASPDGTPHVHPCGE